MLRTIEDGVPCDVVMDYKQILEDQIERVQSLQRDASSDSIKIAAATEIRLLATSLMQIGEQVDVESGWEAGFGIADEIDQCTQSLVMLGILEESNGESHFLYECVSKLCRVSSKLRELEVRRLKNGLWRNSGITD